MVTSNLSPESLKLSNLCCNACFAILLLKTAMDMSAPKNFSNYACVPAFCFACLATAIGQASTPRYEA